MSETTITENDIAEALGKISDPEIGRTLSELKMLTKVTLQPEGTLQVEVELPTPAYPGRERIAEAVQNSVQKNFPQVSDVRTEFVETVKGKNTGGSIGLRIKNVVAVGSGKGGVGKSTVAASLAFGLNASGAKVGLMDADVYGPSLPHLLGVADSRPTANEYQNEEGQTIQRIEPVMVNGVKMISMGFFVEPEKAVIWRGPMLHRAINQFLRETDWGELDYLIIDMPPGTGDVALTLSQSLGLSGAVVVCTPQQVALLDAVKAISMFRQVNIPVLGIVENMSGDIFGRGGAKQKAEEMQVPFLGEVPIEAEIRIKSDEGKAFQLVDSESPASDALLEISQRTAIEIAKQLVESPSMPSLEVL